MYIVHDAIYTAVSNNRDNKIYGISQFICAKNKSDRFKSVFGYAAGMEIWKTTALHVDK